MHRSEVDLEAGYELLSLGEAASMEDAPAQLRSRARIEAVLLRIWREALDCPELGVDGEFFDVGGDSLRAAQIASMIEEVFGVTVPLTSFIVANTVAQLTELLVEGRVVVRGSPVAQLKPGGNQPPLFIAPTVGGHLFRYQALVARLSSDRPVFGLLPERQAADTRDPDSIEAMAEQLAANVSRAQPRGPIHLCGFCLGGLLAYEIARQLEQSGRELGMVALLDTPAPGYPGASGPAPRLARAHVHRALSRLGFHASGVRLARGRERLDYVCGVVRRKVRRLSGLPHAGLSHLATGKLAETMARNERAYRMYRGRSYPGSVTLFRAKHTLAPIFDRQLGWGKWVSGSVKVLDVPGFHTFILEEPWVRVLGKELSRCLRGESNPGYTCRTRVFGFRRA